MDLTPAAEWQPPDHWQRMTVIDSHTGGEPFRVVVDGLPDIPGDTVLERRRYAMEHLDWLRKALMWEPRGHADMYGGWLGDPVGPNSDLAVLFTHNEGFSTMCGHGIIALAKVILDTGIITGTDTLRIDTPAGQILSTATRENGSVREVSFVNVPSFASDLDATVDVEGLGAVPYDLAFGGAFYAYVDAGRLGLPMDDASALVQAGRRIKQAIASGRRIDHHDSPDLGFLYGVIFTGPAESPANHSRHVCVFADGEVDRSPTGTGVGGRLAILHARGELGPGDEVAIESIVGSVFRGRILEMTTAGPHPAVVPQISGTAAITGRSELWFDPDDPLGSGFLIR